MSTWFSKILRRSIGRQNALRVNAPVRGAPRLNALRSGNRHLIELRDVVKRYSTGAGEFVALKHIDLCINSHEFVAIVGKSGSGKSTLINMITGIDRPSSGEVYIGDTAVHTLSEDQIALWRGKNVGVIFQFFQLLPTLTLLENVMLPMDFCGVYSAEQRRRKALALLKRVDLAPHAHKLPSACSGGQQQRAAIARALANDPPILVADEPTGNLDSRTAGAIFDLFAQLVSEGKTILMVTHDQELAARAMRVIHVADGEIDGAQPPLLTPGMNIFQAGSVQEISRILEQLLQPPA